MLFRACEDRRTEKKEMLRGDFFFFNLQMKTWPTAPQAAKHSTSLQTAGYRAMKSRAARSSPAEPATSMPSHSPTPVATSQGLTRR